jgi:hypothetical protein
MHIIFAWAFSLIAGLVFLNYPALILSSLLLVVWSWMQSRALLTEPTHAYSKRLALGMSFCFIGDLGMATGILMLAMVFFALGHACYIWGMTGLARLLEVKRRKARGLMILLFVLIGFGVWFYVVLNGRQGIRGGNVLLYAALAYTVFLSVTVGVAAGIAACDRRFVTLFVGAALFFISDAFIALRIFRPDGFAMVPVLISSRVVWFTYGIGQFLILNSQKNAHLKLL